MNTLVLYDVARRSARQRLESLLRRHGFVWLFPYARWSSSPVGEHSDLIRGIRGQLKGEAYRVVLIEMTPANRKGARWMMASATQTR